MPDPSRALVDIAPLTARSAVLSLLLGIHPPELAVSEIVAAGTSYGLSEATVRVALTRMVAADELERHDSVYRLSGRMLNRQAAQDEALDPAVRPWTGGWETVVVVEAGRSAPDRVRLRSTLAALRLGELREGVWMRPTNLQRDIPPAEEYLVLRDARIEDDIGLASRVWPLPKWAATADALASLLTTAPDPGRRLAVGAAVFRHLLTDPLLPVRAAPPRWPAMALRQQYTEFATSTASTVRDD